MVATKAKPAAREDTPGGQPSITERFHAWWEGYDIAPKPKPVKKQAAVEIEDSVELEDEWPTEHKDVLQAIWGEGYSGPGGSDYVLSLVKSFGLSPASSMIEFGSGMGGSTRAIAEAYGAYVTGWEINPEFAAQANSLALVYSLEKQAEVHVLDLETMAFRSNFYQSALIGEFLYRLEDKRAFLQEALASVKQGSEIMITELVSAGSTEALDDWIAGEAEPIHLEDIRTLAEQLGDANVSVRLAEEESDRYTAMIKQSLNNLVTHLAEAKPPREKVIPILTEVEKWARRVAALESGGLHYYRINGVKT